MKVIYAKLIAQLTSLLKIRMKYGVTSASIIAIEVIVEMAKISLRVSWAIDR